jgi:hypothetical protein
MNVGASVPTARFLTHRELHGQPLTALVADAAGSGAPGEGKRQKAKGKSGADRLVADAAGSGKSP